VGLEECVRNELATRATRTAQSSAIRPTANIITYAPARFDQEALEDAKLGHGLFTYAVAEGLDAKAGDFADKREITTKGLAQFVIKRVGELAKGMTGKKVEQQPQCFRPGCAATRVPRLDLEW